MASSAPSERDAFAIAAPGLAPLLAAELTALGVQVRAVEAAGVAFHASDAVLFRVNCWSRLATRVVVRLDSFVARDFATLEKRARRVPWREVLAPGEQAVLSVTCRKSRLYHSDAVAERVARGIELAVPGVRAATGPDDDDADSDPNSVTNAALHVDEDTITDATARARAGVHVHVHEKSNASRAQRILVRLDRDMCTISADASGDLLHRRGWRLDSGKAPLRETLAAALIAASDWPANVPLVDPMCGAGTIAIEAALRARNIAPGLSRTFACEHWPGADPALAAGERDAARAAMLLAAPARIVAADRDAGAIEATRTNAERAGVLDDITLQHQPLSDIGLAQIGAAGWVVTNPPYGIRTGNPATLAALWGRLGAVIREAGAGWTLTVVVPDPAFAKELRLPLDRVVVTTTGGRQVAFLKSRLPKR